MRNLVVGILAALLAGGLSLTGCGPSGDEGASSSLGEAAEKTSASGSPSPVQKASTAPPPERPPNERPVPAFGGVTLDDRKLASGDLLGKRYLLFVFNPEVDVAAPAAEAVSAVARLRGSENFGILGVATGSRRATAQAFASEHDLDFPILDDSTARIAGILRAPVPVLLAVVDAEGYVIATTGWPEKSGIDAGVVERSVRNMLRLRAAPTPTRPLLGEKPPAPEIAGVDLEGQAFRLSAQRGHAVLVIFFLHTCPHCHHALEFLKENLPKIPEAQRPQLVGVSILDRAYAVRERLKADGLDFFPVLMDPDDGIREAYGATGGVPDLVLVDAQGRIVHRSNGWADERDPALWRMWLAKAGGAPIPMLLHRTGYSGDEFCGVCHELEATTHAFTQHAYAFDTLVKHGVSRDPECVSCHVVGFGQKGGYAFDSPSEHLEDVGCESCHGRGGPHLSPGWVENGDYAARCVTCHDPKHSLGFDYASFWPRISHEGNTGVLSLSLAQKLERLEALGAPRTDLLPTEADYVGSAACRSCHAAEFETWAAGGHAEAGATLVAKGKAGDAACLACHTTGFGKPGGFPKTAALDDHPDLGRVGCESCHGPGSEHVADGAARTGNIVSLTDKCDSCVILQICGGCHDDANDPGFEFEVKMKIERQRHGTIEPSATKQEQSAARSPGQEQSAARSPGQEQSAARRLPDAAVLGALEHALAAGPAS